MHEGITPGKGRVIPANYATVKVATRGWVQRFREHSSAGRQNDTPKNLKRPLFQTDHRHERHRLLPLATKTILRENDADQNTT